MGSGSGEKRLGGTDCRTRNLVFIKNKNKSENDHPPEPVPFVGWTCRLQLCGSIINETSCQHHHSCQHQHRCQHHSCSQHDHSCQHHHSCQHQHSCSQHNLAGYKQTLQLGNSTTTREM